VPLTHIGSIIIYEGKIVVIIHSTLTFKLLWKCKSKKESSDLYVPLFGAPIVYLSEPCSGKGLSQELK
jgi:hypothetical protein